jgi:hypothetical protein
MALPQTNTSNYNGTLNALLTLANVPSQPRVHAQLLWPVSPFPSKQMFTIE